MTPTEREKLEHIYTLLRLSKVNGHEDILEIRELVSELLIPSFSQLNGLMRQLKEAAENWKPYGQIEVTPNQGIIYEVNMLQKRMVCIEEKVAELDARTSGMVKYGPPDAPFGKQYEADMKEVDIIVNAMLKGGNNLHVPK